MKSHLHLPSNGGSMVDDSFQAFLVDGASFTENEEYPIIPARMVSSEKPLKIMPFNKAISSRGDLSGTHICFFAPDKTFERVRRNPRKFLAFFKRTAGIIGFDYSIHTDMPVIKQKSQINDNLSLTYFYGSHGIPVIPNLRCGVDYLLPEFLSAMPRNTYVAVGTHGFIKESQQRHEWFCFLEEVIKQLQPKAIIVYGPLPDSIFKPLKQYVEFIRFTSWIAEDRKRRSGYEH